MYKLVLSTEVWSTTGLLCQASATNPSRLNTVQPISLGNEPPAPSVHLSPCSNPWAWLNHETHGVLKQSTEEVLPAFTLAGCLRRWINYSDLLLKY